MEKVNANWAPLKMAWATIAGLALVCLVFVKRDWVQGLALAFLCLSAFAMVVDVFAERRARVYSDAIAVPGPRSPAP